MLPTETGPASSIAADTVLLPTAPSPSAGGPGGISDTEDLETLQLQYLDVGDVPDLDPASETYKRLMAQQIQVEIDSFRELLAEAREAGDEERAATYKRHLMKELADLKALRDRRPALLLPILARPSAALELL